MKIHKIRFSAAGTTHEGRAGYYQGMDEAKRRGEKLGFIFQLTAEPSNPHDPNAIKIEAVQNDGRVCIGYVPATLARGLSAVCQKNNGIPANLLHVLQNARGTWFGGQFEIEVSEAEWLEMRDVVVMDNRWTIEVIASLESGPVDDKE